MMPLLDQCSVWNEVVEGKLIFYKIDFGYQIAQIINETNVRV